jgi:hypothetical protein
MNKTRHVERLHRALVTGSFTTGAPDERINAHV